ncbi:MAG: SMC-Scp complex subunit ScpB [Erysipelotrichaceae bacterium]|nr:SMC-Scp complex subunit ScpB [Erysipelotrichaceae bacterium]
MNHELYSLIEGVLFVVGDDGVETERLAAALELPEPTVQEALDEMVTQYANDDRRGIELVVFGGRYKFVSKALIHPVAQKLFEQTSAKTFSQAALETLAIIAYKQPITRVEIEEIRSVGCDMMIRKLLARNLIKEVGRSDAPGKPFLYAVTEEFLDTFSLASIQELPELPSFREEQEADSEQLFG